MVPENKTASHGSIRKFTGTLILLWIAALIILIGFNILAHDQFTADQILFGNLLIVVLLTLLIILPLVRKIHDQFHCLAVVNKELEEKSHVLERSRRSAVEELETAQRAESLAQERRDAAERLAAIVASSQDAILGKTMEGVITSWNNGAEKIYGYTRQEAIGQSIRLIVPPEKLEELQTIMAKLRRGERLEPFETVRRRKDGRSIDVSLSVSPLRDAEGRLIGASAIARDITEIKKAQQVLQDREKWFRSLIENSSDLLLQLDPEGRIIFASPSLNRILGYDIEEVLDRSIFEFIHPDDLILVRSLFSDLLLKAENMVSGEARFRHKDQSWRWLEGSGKNLLFNPHIKAVVINARDFSERKRFEEKLQNFAAELKKNNEELESFAFIASHDLQEPLRIVSSYAQLFSQRYQGKLDETSSRYLNYIIDNVKRMQDMISGLLMYSRVGRQGQPMTLVDCGKVCDTALANLTLSITKKNVNIQKGNLPIILANEVELLQLFQNLIGNAIKYSDKEHPVVEITSYKGDDHWIFCISDNGIGIEQEYYQQIFEIFKRLHTQKEYPGTGIGLSICKKIIDNAGGEIWVESVLGAGSKFFFRWPVRQRRGHDRQDH